MPRRLDVPSPECPEDYSKWSASPSPRRTPVMCGTTTSPADARSLSNVRLMNAISEPPREPCSLHRESKRWCRQNDHGNQLVNRPRPRRVQNTAGRLGPPMQRNDWPGARTVRPASTLAIGIASRLATHYAYQHLGSLTWKPPVSGCGNARLRHERRNSDAQSAFNAWDDLL